MSRRRRILLSAAVLAACVGIALGVLAMLPLRIEEGARAEVKTVFGERDGEVIYTTFHETPETIPDKLRRWLHLPK